MSLTSQTRRGPGCNDVRMASSSTASLPFDQIPTREQIRAARELVDPHLRRTPVLDVELDSGHTVTLKLELLQHTGSFKPRGAFHCVLSAEQKPQRLVAASGGNHGLAVAYAGMTLGIPVEIFVPTTAPAVKVARLHTLGATVHQVGQRFSEALEASLAAAAEPGTLPIHAYEDLPTVIGQGTLAVELDEQTDNETVLVAVGGGGLIGGLASWWGQDKRIIAVEPEQCPTLHSAVEAGHPVSVQPGGCAMDALGPSLLGSIGFSAVQNADVTPLLVEDADIKAARQWLWRTARIAGEPGGVTALAALTSGAYRPRDGERITVIVCGANADPCDLSDLPDP